jgi:hypothetical protein
MSKSKDVATGPLSPSDRDPTFGEEGVVRLRTPRSDSMSLRCLGFLDEYTLLVGLSEDVYPPYGNNATNFVLSCLNTVGGTLDESFASGGFLSGQYSGADSLPRGISVVSSFPISESYPPGGGIVLYGISSWASLIPAGSWSMASLGILDTTGQPVGAWGVRGTRAVDLPGDRVLGFAHPFFAPDGRLRLIGTVHASTGARSGAVVYLNDKGWLDASVNENGIISFMFDGSISDVVADGFGRFTVVGTTDTRAIVSRIDGDGVVDMSFGVNGVVSLDPPDPTRDKTTVTRAVSLVGGGTLCVGDCTIAGTGTAHERYGLLAVLTSDGSYDPNFNDGECLLLRDFPEGQLVGVVVDAEGRYVVAASLRANGVIVARLLPTGEVDASFAGEAGYLQDTIGPGDQVFGSMAIDSEGRIYVGGHVTGITQPASAYLVRYMGQD